MGKFPRKVQRWQCSICEELYETEDECSECCIDDKDKEVDVWQCIECEEIYDDKDEAYNCCG